MQRLYADIAVMNLARRAGLPPNARPPQVQLNFSRMENSSLSKKCAYCGSTGPFSREHVWPKCFLERLGKRYAHYSPKSDKVHGADYVVRDVCTSCNNEELSELDVYFCSLYDRYFKEPRGFEEAVAFEYDYDLLERSLLKIAYNTARSAGSETIPLERVAGYILHGSSRPNGLAVIAELVSPTYIEDNSRPISVIKEVRPTLYRSALGRLDTPHGFAVLVRIVAINSFFFHFLLARDLEDMGSFLAAVGEFLEGIRGSVMLSPDNDHVLLKTSAQDSISSILPLMHGKRSEYKMFFDSQKTRFGGKKPDNS